MTSYSTSDTPRIRQAVLEIARSPVGAGALHERLRARTGVEVHERRMYRALRWALSRGFLRRIPPEAADERSTYYATVQHQVSTRIDRPRRRAA